MPDIKTRRIKQVGKHRFQESSVSWQIARILEKEGIDHEFTQPEKDAIASLYSPTDDDVLALIEWVRSVVRRGRRPTLIR